MTMETATLDVAMTELTVAERAELGRYEAVIQRNLTGFLEASRALLAIRDGKLYRTTHGTFEDYCRERWDISRSYGYRMISAAEVVENLSPIGDILPANEAQTRPLATLEPDQQVAAWKQATEVAGGKPTAAQVQQAADEIKPRYAPIWELESKIKEWLASETPFDTGALTMLDTMHGLRRHLYHDRLATHLRNNAVSYRPSDLRQAINNVRDQRRQEQRIAGSKAVYTGDKPEPAQATTEAEPQSKPTPIYEPPIPADATPTEPPSDEELAAMAAVEAAPKGHPVEEDRERAAREVARVGTVSRIDEIVVRDLLRSGIKTGLFRAALLSANIPQLEAAMNRIDSQADMKRFFKIGNRRELLLSAQGVAEMTTPVEEAPATIDATGNPLGAAPTLPADLNRQIGGYVAELTGVQMLLHEIVSFIVDEMSNDGKMRAYVDNVRRPLQTLIDRLKEEGTEK